jgi:hypothetical protein
MQAKVCLVDDMLGEDAGEFIVCIKAYVVIVTREAPRDVSFWVLVSRGYVSIGDNPRQRLARFCKTREVV